jgi:hypothetical protein
VGVSDEEEEKDDYAEQEGQPVRDKKINEQHKRHTRKIKNTRI